MLNTTTIEDAIDFVLNYNFSYIPRKTLYLHLQKIAETANKTQAADDFIKASQELTPYNASTQSLPQEAEAVILTEVDNLLKNNPTSRWDSSSAWLKELSASIQTRQIIHPILIRYAVSTWNQELFDELLNDGYDTSYVYNEDEGLNVLMIATREGRTNFVRALIKARANVNLKDKKGRTALWFAAGWNKPISLKDLIEAGADVNHVNHENCGWTALMYASRNGRTECVKALIAGKADLNLKDNDGWTPLMSAARYGHTECVKALVSAGADRHIKLPSTGNFALTLAAYAGHDECVKALIIEKSDVNQQTSYGETALMQASFYNNINCVNALIAAHADLNIQTKNSKETALHYATKKGNIDCAKAIIEAGANLNIKDSNGNTALQIAVKNGYSDIMNAIKRATQTDINVHIDVWSTIRLAINNKNIASLNTLIEMRPNLNHLDRAGYSHLMIAAQLGFTEGVEALIAANANLNIKNEGGSALVYAAKNGHTGCVQALIKANADLNITDSNGNSALFLAVQNGHQDCVRELLKTNTKLDVWRTLRHAVVYKSIDCLNAIISKKTDVNIPDAEGKSHLHVAVEKGFTEGVKILIAAKADVNYTYNNRTPLMEAARAGYADIVKALINAKCNVNYQYLYRCCYAINSYIEQTALMHAAENGHLECVKLLIAAKAKINATTASHDSKGITALHYAAMRGHANVVSALIDAGANVNEGNYSGWTPLMYAAECGKLACVNVLVKAKAKVNAKVDKSKGDPSGGTTALMMAAKHGKLDCVRALIAAGADVRFKDQNGKTAEALARASLSNAKNNNKEGVHIYEDIIRELLIAEKETKGFFSSFFK